MNKQSSKRIRKAAKCLATAVIVITGAVIMLSFTAQKMADDFLKQLGISKVNADAKIESSILEGSLDQFGLRNAKNIALGNRAVVTKDLLNYVKARVNSDAFIKAYNETKQQQKPTMNILKTPEENQKERIDNAKKLLAETETNYKKADATLKPVFEKMVTEAKKQLKDAEDPNSKTNANYRKNYVQSAKFAEEGNKRMLAEWEAKYPANHLLFVKNRMQQFLDETKDIDFNAELVIKNGKKIFVNRAYESKGNTWKMGFRAGKEVVETSRIFIQNWMNEIK